MPAHPGVPAKVGGPRQTIRRLHREPADHTLRVSCGDLTPKDVHGPGTIPRAPGKHGAPVMCGETLRNHLNEGWRGPSFTPHSGTKSRLAALGGTRAAQRLERSISFTGIKLVMVMP